MDGVNRSLVRLSKRLEAVAQLIPHCHRFADIGTDHAFLPIYCVQHDIADSAIAGDIAEGPCAQARRQVQKYALIDRIQVRCGAGLSILEPGEVTGISINGMGSSTIVKILESSLSQVADLQFMVLQPQSDYDELRKWLQEHHFKICAEDILMENEIGYQIILAKPGWMAPLSQLEAYYGPLNIQVKSQALRTAMMQDLAHSQQINVQVAKSTDPKAQQKHDEVTMWMKLIMEYLDLS